MLLQLAWAVAIPAGVAIACLVVLLWAVKLDGDHSKAGCLLMSAAALVGLTAFAALALVAVLGLGAAPIYIAQERGGQVRISRNVVVGSPVYVLTDGARQKLSVRWAGPLLVNDTSRQMRIHRVLYNRIPIAPGLVKDEPTVVAPYSIMPLSHGVYHFGPDDRPPDHVRVEKGQQADARYQIIW